MVSITYVSQCLKPVPDTEAAQKCLHGMNSCHKAVLKGKRLKKRNLLDKKSGKIRYVIVKQVEMTYLTFSPGKNFN